MSFTEPKFENIPQELKNLPRWVTWKAEGAEGEKPRKVPYAPDRPNTRASSTDTTTWGTFQQAEAAFFDGDRTGIGFVLNNDGIVGVDIDNCISDGAINPDAISMLEWLGAEYIEVSPSGTGLRAFGYAPPLDRGVKGKIHGLDVELYTTGRYLTLTGETVKHGKPFTKLENFADLANDLRGAGRDVINPETGEIEIAKPHDRHAELIKRVLSGDVFHDSLRDLAASFVANGMNAGAAVSQLRALMQVCGADHDERWKARYKQIPALVRSAQGKFSPLVQSIQSDGLNEFETSWLISADEFSNAPAPISWIVKHWLQSQALIMVHGPSGGGKTFVVLDWCLRIASGISEWAGNKVKPGNVIYLAGEGHHGLRGRVAAWKHHHEAGKLNMWLSRDGCDLNTAEGYLRVTKSIEKLDSKPDLIVVDTLHRFLLGDENSAQDAKTMLDACNALMKEFNCSVLLVHHTGVSDESQHRARGSSAWKGALDIEISVIPSKKDAPMQIVQRKSKDAELSKDIYATLKSVDIPGWIDEDGEQVSSAVIQIEEAPEEMPSKNTKVDNFVRLIEECWIKGGSEIKLGRPYVSRSIIKEKMESDTTLKPRTIENSLSPAYKDKLIGCLIENEVLEPTEHGWVVCGEWGSFMVLRQKFSGLSKN